MRDSTPVRESPDISLFWRTGFSSDSIAVVIPCYRVRNHILAVLANIPREVHLIIVVDDGCPENTGAYVAANCADARVVVLNLEQNQGVGAAVMTGYRFALEHGADIVVKLDGDGQMDPRLIPRLVLPILMGQADYTKGNRFYNPEDVSAMPPLRMAGNAALAFITKMSSGYWNIFDPTNGYTAISSSVLQELPLAKIAPRYFFESDMLFRLGTVRACVVDVPMTAIYGQEKSGLHLTQASFHFAFRHAVNAFKRILYNYFLRDFTIASVELLVGVVFVLFGTIFGAHAWDRSIQTGIAATTGTVMLAALPVIVGVQLLVSFLAYDIAATPHRPIHRLLATISRGPEAAPVAEPEQPNWVR